MQLPENEGGAGVAQSVAERIADRMNKLLRKPPLRNDKPAGKFVTRAQLQEYSAATDKDILAPIRAKYGPLLEKISAALEMADDPMRAEIERLRPQIEAMRNDLPNILQKNPQAARVLEQFISSAVLDGLRPGGKQASNKGPKTLGMA
jgi:hypothetical protein